MWKRGITFAVIAMDSVYSKILRRTMKTCFSECGDPKFLLFFPVQYTFKLLKMNALHACGEYATFPDGMMRILMLDQNIAIGICLSQLQFRSFEGLLATGSSRAWYEGLFG